MHIHVYIHTYIYREMYIHAAQKYKQIYIYKYIEVHARNTETLTRVALLKTKKNKMSYTRGAHYTINKWIGTYPNSTLSILIFTIGLGHPNH